MHPHEEALIRAFIYPHRRTRWLESLASANRRGHCLDRLNHCRDLDERYTSLLPSDADIVSILRAGGAPPTCYVLSGTAAIELAVLARQCLDRRLGSEAEVDKECAAWERDRNADGSRVTWRFTTEDARIKLKHLYPHI